MIAAIDSAEWNVEHMLFHVSACLDTMLKDMRPEVRDDLLVLLGSRYGLVSRDWRHRALQLQEELMNAGDTRKMRPS